MRLIKTFKKWTRQPLIKFIQSLEPKILKVNETKHISKDFYIVVQGKVTS